MSRGGFGGGRGGFGGGANRSGAQQLMSFDLIKDVGVNGLFNVQTALFPKMDVPVPRKPSSVEQTQWQLRKDYLERIKNSPFYLTVPPPPKDIERYSDRYKQTNHNKRKLRDIKTNLDMFPEELQSILDPSKTKKKRKQQARDDFGQIEELLNKANEDKEDEEEDGEKAAGSDAEVEEEEYEDEEDLVDDNDYGQNYFDNGEDDGDGDDDGDGEVYY
ncbi:DNA-directed RNA polymerase III, subunit Rpc31 [Halteromyces radiatus]|uniref:DNA-directed RNA polymerase III, subunit Rpc31 n=1 Tax=Halteromyces radiatus TaxID=101107 RepID=UPI00221FAD61|nr:DNA-directed RNA polymerase III, subunit Rpc31 [Halteromyces radiatus]KAI8100055.1 DNA-directed RNA polymerase III, subunit Rpc31 [Halteromyces radiatus]